MTRVPQPVPTIYFGGSSPAAVAVAATHADVYLTWGEPPAQVAEKIATVRAAPAGRGREVRFGVRLHVITRDTADAAWAEAQRLLDALDPAAIEAVQAGLARSESEGQRRMRALHGGSTANLEIAPNLWAGVGLVRGGAGLVFPKLFFPVGNDTAATLLAFGTFAVGFVARPIGGVLFGHVGDRLGRKRTLVATMVLMGAAMALIGLLPPVSAFGVAAPVLLVVLRILQGLAVGEEWGGALEPPAHKPLSTRIARCI